MIFKYLKHAARLLYRNPFFTFINIAGLSVGFAVFIVLWPYAQFELMSDQFHPHAERIFRLSRHFEIDVEGKAPFAVNLPTQPCSVAKQAASEFSEVEALTRIVFQPDFQFPKTFCAEEVYVSVYEGDNKHNFREKNTALADPNFFQFFSFPFVYGDPQTALTKPRTVVLSESISRKYFGDRNPVEKIIYLYDSIPLTVTGVFKSLPNNTHFVLDIVISDVGVDAMNIPGWDNSVHGYNYIRTSQVVDRLLLQAAMNKHIERYYGCKQCNGIKANQTFYLQTIPSVMFEIMPANVLITKSEIFLKMLCILSFVILGLAWINYVSLSVNMLYRRFHEIGARKVIGASKSDFILQFFMESTLTNLIAIALALTIVQLAKGPAQQLFQFYVVDWASLRPQTFAIMLFTICFGIGITGLYPSLISFRKNPIELLKRLHNVHKPSWIHAVVTFQFTAAIALLIWTGAIYFQLDLLLTKNIGIDTNGIITIQAPLEQKSDFENKLTYFNQQARQISGVENIAVSKSVIGDYAGFGIAVKRSADSDQFGLNTNGGVDENFVPLYNIQLIAGRNFASNRPSDKKSILLSKTATERLGFKSPAAAVGGMVLLPWQSKEAEVIGVYDEYYFRPFYLNANPARVKGPESFLTYKNFLIPDSNPSKISVRIQLDRVKSITEQLNSLFKKVFPEEIFDWNFIDENVNRHYMIEKVSRNQMVLFTLIAVGLGCLGLLGTVANRASEKNKEIGIRKILGAKMYHISSVLMNTSLKQITVATVMSLPLSYYLTQQYLQKFSEHITLEWWHYVVPICFMIVILIATVGSILLKTASSNPVDALKHDS
ncbi:MAG: ABC transporter permease [Chryseolinea sp.]